jgi:hypothetical protein
MYVTPPSQGEDASRQGEDASRQFWFLTGRVLVCDDTADLAAYLGVTVNNKVERTLQGCAHDLAAGQKHGTPISKGALFFLVNQRLAGVVDRCALVSSSSACTACTSSIFSTLLRSQNRTRPNLRIWAVSNFGPQESIFFLTPRLPQPRSL